jgi:hypothetical protein
MRLLRIACLWALAAAGLACAQPTITSVLDPYTGANKLAPGGQAVITGTNPVGVVCVNVAESVPGV